MAGIVNTVLWLPRREDHGWCGCTFRFQNLPLKSGVGYVRIWIRVRVGPRVGLLVKFRVEVRVRLRVVMEGREALASIVLNIEWVQFILQDYSKKLQNYNQNRAKNDMNSDRGLNDKQTTPDSSVYLIDHIKRLVYALPYL